MTDTDKEQPDQNCCKWIKDHLGIVLTIIGIVITLLAVLATWLDALTFEYAIQILKLAYTTLGTFFGLMLGARKLKAYKQKLKVNEARLFNDRQEQAVKSLASKKLHIRTEGVRILGDLHKTADPANQKLIRKLLLDFICNKADIYALEMEKEKETKTESKAKTERGWRVDIKVAIKILGELVSGKTMSPEERGAELNMQKLDLRYFDLSYTKLQGADFRGANLQETYFWGANLQKTVFWGAILNRVILQGADLTGADLRNIQYLTREQDIKYPTYEQIAKDFNAELGTTIYKKDNPPKLDKELTIPENRAYERVPDENGNMRRRFVHNKEWIDPPIS